MSTASFLRLLLLLVAAAGLAACGHAPTSSHPETWHGTVVDGPDAAAALPALERAQAETGFNPAGWTLQLNQDGAHCGLRPDGHLFICQAAVHTATHQIELWWQGNEAALEREAVEAFCAAGAPRCGAVGPSGGGAAPGPTVTIQVHA